MSDYRFEWNPAKARENFRKHGVSFEEARSVFSDDQALMSLEGDGSIRLISARKATRTERAQYGARWMR